MVKDLYTKKFITTSLILTKDLKQPKFNSVGMDNKVR